MEAPMEPQVRTEGGVRESPFCLELWSKRRHFARGLPREESDVLDASQSCWCRRTMQAIGPDGELVDPDDCRAGRGCFVPPLG
jgi:hypothetical protein